MWYFYCLEFFNGRFLNGSNIFVSFFHSCKYFSLLARIFIIQCRQNTIHTMKPWMLKWSTFLALCCSLPHASRSPGISEPASQLCHSFEMFAWFLFHFEIEMDATIQYTHTHTLTHSESHIENAWKMTENFENSNQIYLADCSSDDAAQYQFGNISNASGQLHHGNGGVRSFTYSQKRRQRHSVNIGKVGSTTITMLSKMLHCLIFQFVRDSAAQKRVYVERQQSKHSFQWIAFEIATE